MTAAPLEYRWLDQNLRFAAGVANAGPRVKANGERYGSASCHLAMALHGVLDDPQSPPGTSTPGLDPPFKQLQALMNGIGNAPLDEARRALVSLVKQVPMLCDARAFAAPAGMHDLPQILATAYYARTGRVNFATNYRRAINRLHWLLLLIQAENILVPGEGLDMERDLDVRAMQARLVERINAPAEDLKLPERLQTRITVTGRDLFPTPAAVIAAIGMSDKPIVEGASDLKDEAVSPRARSFVQFVTEIDLYFLDETTMHQLGPDASTQARYLGHMRAMLQDAAPRLAAGVMPCDRTPIVSPWYAAIVLAVRNYAITLAFVLGAPKADDASAVPWTLFSLSALGDTSVAAELCSKLAPEQIPISLRPFDSLFAARSKSMYVCAREQTGPWWVLLRATLSGLTIAGADALAHAMVEATQNDDSLVASEMHVKMRNAVMLCALMHTQTGMRVLGHRIGSANDITAFPLADMVSRIKDPVCGQTPIDMVMCTYSGTSDLAALASDDLAFNEGATRRQEYAWIQELSQRAVAVELPAYPPPTPAPAVVAETVDGFCAALKAMGLDYLDSCVKSGGGRISLSDQRAAVPFESAVTKEELLNTLCRASTAHASLHCGTWLTVAFAFAVELERHYQTTEWPLLRSPCCDGRAVDRLKDEAWLRSHFCYLTEQALHSSRSGGMWAAGKHLVLVAWVATEEQKLDGRPLGGEDPDADNDANVMMFARAITPHTVRGNGILADDALLLTPDWRREVEARGWDSVVECARAFERALHARNTIEQRRIQLAREGEEQRYREQFPDKSGDVPLPPLDAAHMPFLPASSVDRQRAAADASGPGCFDATAVRPLDKATEIAMERFRLRTHEAMYHRDILICRTNYEHGVAVAVLGVPCDADDISTERRIRRAGYTATKRTTGMAGLVARLGLYGHKHEVPEDQRRGLLG